MRLSHYLRHLDPNTSSHGGPVPMRCGAPSEDQRDREIVRAPVREYMPCSVCGETTRTRAPFACRSWTCDDCSAVTYDERDDEIRRNGGALRFGAEDAAWGLVPASRGGAK